MIPYTVLIRKSLEELPPTAKVLVVEDSASVRLSLEFMLKAHNYTILTAADGVAALALLEKEAVDLVLTDLCMPGMDGLQLLHEIHLRFPTLPVVLLTGYGSLDTAIEALRERATDYLLKPCTEERLLECIDKALTSRDLAHHLSEGNLSTVAALVRAIEARNPHSLGHSERVAHYAFLLAQQLGQTIEQSRTIWLAGLLHDIGKIGVRDAVLCKTEALDEDEIRQIQEHVTVAAQILAPIAPLSDLVPIILHHHERYDGSGYPHRLRGEEIPLGARLLAIVDSFEALTSGRAYRQAFSTESALRILAEGCAVQWDPVLVPGWVRLVLHRRSSLLPSDDDWVSWKEQPNHGSSAADYSHRTPVGNLPGRTGQDQAGDAATGAADPV